MGKPFAWTAGRNLFKWFGTLGVDEETFRDNVYMAAVCRCFPGKNPKGGDRVPSEEEIANCAPWLERELEICRPELDHPRRQAGDRALPGGRAAGGDDRQACTRGSTGARHRRHPAAASVGRVDLVSRRAGQDADEEGARAHRQARGVGEDQGRLKGGAFARARRVAVGEDGDLLGILPADLAGHAAACGAR